MLLYVIISSFFVFPVYKSLTNNVFRPSSPYIHAVDRWSIPLARTQGCKWSLCSSVQNIIFDEENKQLDQKGTMEEETENMAINMFHSVLCGASNTHAISDYAIKEMRTDKKIPIVLLHGLLGSARNFQSWMKLVQQKEIEIERDERLLLQQPSIPPLYSTRDIICMDLRNHGRTGSHYGTLEMDFEIMAKDLIHTLQNLGLTRVHVVGHSLGGKVAAVAALHLAEEEEERLKKSTGSDLGSKGKDNDKESIIEIISLTLIDVSPVDYADDEAFGEVFRTLDIVEVLNDQLPFIGTEPLSDDGSTPSSGGEREREREREREKAADRAGPHARNMLSSLLGGRVEDPMLKAFLLASIQPIDRRNKIGVGAMAVDGGDLGGLGSSIRDVMNKIQSTKKLFHPHKVALGLGVALGVGQISGAGESDSSSNSNSRASGSGSTGGFEWKFSVEGIARFREQLGGWPTRYSNDDHDHDDDSAEAGSIESDLRAAAGKNDHRKSSRAVDILQEGGKGEGEGRGEGEGTSVSAGSTVAVTPYTNPVLVMKGALSKFVKSSHIAPIATLFPLFTLLTVRDAGHWLHFEKPKESSESLIKFIRRVEDRHREINNAKT